MPDTQTQTPPQELSDDELIQRLNAGYVEDSLQELQQRHRAAIHQFVHGLVHDDHLAQDVTQETFEKVFLKSHLYEPRGRFRAWLFEVARNQALSMIRARQRCPRPFSSFAGTDGARTEFEDMLNSYDSPVLEERELMAAFKLAVAELPQRYREAFSLCALQGLQYQDAARLLGIPTGTVAIRIMRARRRLFEALSHHLERLRRPPACLQ